MALRYEATLWRYVMTLRYGATLSPVFVHKVVILSDKYRLLSARLSLTTWLTHQPPYCACVFGGRLLYLESS